MVTEREKQRQTILTHESKNGIQIIDNRIELYERRLNIWKTGDIIYHNKRWREMVWSI